MCVGVLLMSDVIYAEPPILSSWLRFRNSWMTVRLSIASPRSCTAHTASHIQPLRRIKKSAAWRNEATSSIESGLMRIDPRTASSASELWGAILSGPDEPFDGLSVISLRLFHVQHYSLLDAK